MLSDLVGETMSHYAKGLPFVIYRKPKEDVVYAIFQNTSELHYINDYSETGFVFAPFEIDEPTVLLLPDKKLRASFVSSLKAMGQNDSLQKIDSSQKEIHIDLVKRAIREIKKDLFEKVVLSRRLEVDNESSPFELFQGILEKYDSAFCYLWYHPKVGTWVGATPEILLNLKGTQLTTMSLAGTKIAVNKENPIWEKKELHEQELVTKYLAAALQNKVSQLKVSDVESVRAGSLWHLRTKIFGILQKGSLGKIIMAMHPTPAVCGMPLQKAKTFIMDNENYKREYYTGFLGELNFKKEKDRSPSRNNMENKAYKAIMRTSTLYVNLRCMKLDKNSSFIYIGGGVTKDSDPEKEWEETVAKSRTMLEILYGKN